MRSELVERLDIGRRGISDDCAVISARGEHPQYRIEQPKEHRRNFLRGVTGVLAAAQLGRSDSAPAKSIRRFRHNMPPRGREKRGAGQQSETRPAFG